MVFGLLNLKCKHIDLKVKKPTLEYKTQALPKRCTKTTFGQALRVFATKIVSFSYNLIRIEINGSKT